MSKPAKPRFPPALALIFTAAGSLILVLGFLNYLQDGTISLSIPFGLLGISSGAFLYSHARKSAARDESGE